eukprot:578432_1
MTTSFQYCSGCKTKVPIANVIKITPRLILTQSWYNRWAKCVNGTHGLLKKECNKELKKKCIRIGNAIVKRKQEKWNIGSDGKSALNDAKNGKYGKKNGDTKKKKKDNKQEMDVEEEEDDPLKNMYAKHAAGQKNKGDYRDARLEQGAQTVKVMQGIGSSIGFMSMETDDYLSLCLDYVENEYCPESEREAIRNEFEKEKNERRVVRMWRAVMRQSEKYTKQRKNARISDVYALCTR